MTSSTTLKFELHLPVESNNQSIIELLTASCELGSNTLKQAIDRGSLWLTRVDDKGNKHTRRLRRIKSSLRPGDTLHLYYDSEVLAQTAGQATLVADEGNYSIWNKPSGMLCQGSKWADHCTITRNVEKQLQRNIYLVHRLDRAASGLVILAHTKYSAKSLAQLFENRQIEKIYRATVHGQYPASDKAKSIDSPIDGKTALSHVRVESYDERSQRSVLEVKIDTGRKHQIRKHLSGYGYPIVGDRQYGREGDTEDLQLRAVELRFTCPETGETRHYLIARD